MCHNLYLWTIVMIMVKINAESSEELQENTFTIYTPSSMGVNDIYNSNNAHTSTEDEIEKKTETPATIDDNNLIKIRMNFIEFHPESTIMPPKVPPPKFILNATSLKSSIKNFPAATTEEPEGDVIKVVPLNCKKIQRGVLDLIFPSPRVKNFKTAFDSFRRLLSHTFRRK